MRNVGDSRDAGLAMNNERRVKESIDTRLQFRENFSPAFHRTGVPSMPAKVYISAAVAVRPSSQKTFWTAWGSETRVPSKRTRSYTVR